MSETLRPTDAFGELFTVDLTDEQQTMVDDAWDEGYERGWKEAVLQCVTTLFPLVDLDELEESEA